MSKDNRYIDSLAGFVHKQNVEAGWWGKNRCIDTCFQLVSTELSEATEGERKDLMDDHLEHRKMGEVELADALIRLLDLAGYFKWKYEETEAVYDFPGETTIAAHWQCSCKLVDLYRAYKAKSAFTNLEYSCLVELLVAISEDAGYDIWTSLGEKMLYNKSRKDHSKEARAKPTGKKV